VAELSTTRLTAARVPVRFHGLPSEAAGSKRLRASPNPVSSGLCLKPVNAASNRYEPSHRRPKAGNDDLFTLLHTIQQGAKPGRLARLERILDTSDG
jgi:hypothetical protein